MATQNNKANLLGWLLLAADIVACMTKPLDIQQLLEILDQHLAVPERGGHPHPGGPS